jgi:hypothetical protein
MVLFGFRVTGNIAAADIAGYPVIGDKNYLVKD